MALTTEEILAEREKTHGPFSKTAEISQEFKRVLVKYGEGKLNDVQAESLGVICHKIARILNGNADYKDHWDDIAGYATLAAREIDKKQENAK